MKREPRTAAPPRRGQPKRPAGPPLPPAAGTRTRILAVAFRLFHERGYHATGVADILAAARVNAGSVYHFFAGKEGLLEAVLEYALTLLGPLVMHPVEQRCLDPIERVFALLAQYRSGMQAWGCRMGCPIGNLALEVADDHAAARALIERNFQQWIAHLRGWLDAAGDRLPADVDRGQLARFVLTVMEGGIMQARASGNLAPFDASVAQLRVHFAALEQIAQTPSSAARQPPSGGTRRQKRALAPLKP